MHEHHAAAGGNATFFREGDQTVHRFTSVNRIQQHAFLLRDLINRFNAAVRRHAVGAANKTVFDQDILRLPGLIPVEHERSPRPWRKFGSGTSRLWR